MNQTDAGMNLTVSKFFDFKHAAQFISIVVIWTLLWKVAQIGGASKYASLWYPSSAITLALLVLGGRKLLLLAIAGPIFNIVALNPFSLEGSTLQSFALFYVTPPLAHVIGYYIGAKILERNKSVRLTFAYLASFFLAAFIGALIAAFLGSISLRYRLGMSWDEWQMLFVRWWAGDFVGAITLTPLALILLNSMSLISSNAKPSPFVFESDIKLIFNYKFIVFLSIFLFVYFLLIILKINYGVYIPYSLPMVFAFASVFYIKDTAGIERLSLGVALVGFVSALTASVSNKLELLVEFNFFLPVFVIAAFSALITNDLRLQNDRLEKRATHDALTGLLNRDGFQIHMEGLTQKLDRRRLCYALIDVDNFKNVNDQFGHAVGDAALRKVAEVLTNLFGKEGYVGRIGGDELAVLMPGVGLTKAKELLENARDAISRLGDFPCTLTTSIGLVQVDEGEAESAIFERADKLLYKAKSSGRNCVMA
jgi:diguanylate cyclase (GGDEF)-like protein